MLTLLKEEKSSHYVPPDMMGKKQTEKITSTKQKQREEIKSSL